ncbi:MAG: hypothetical protein WCH98_10710, partial [Verrucomicrobiota bacterium]
MNFISPVSFFALPRAVPAFLISLAMVGTGPVRGAEPSDARKVAEDFSGGAWGPSSFVTAPGVTSVVAERASDMASGGSLKVRIPFSGQGFEHFTAAPAKPLYTPGNVRRITLRVKRDDKRLPVK